MEVDKDKLKVRAIIRKEKCAADLWLHGIGKGIGQILALTLPITLRTVNG